MHMETRTLEACYLCKNVNNAVIISNQNSIICNIQGSKAKKVTSKKKKKKKKKKKAEVLIGSHVLNNHIIVRPETFLYQLRYCIVLTKFTLTTLEDFVCIKLLVTFTG